MVGALYLGVGIGSIVVLVWSFLWRRRSAALVICGVISVLFGASLAGLFLHDGTGLLDDLPDWLFALVPFVWGGIACVRLVCIRHDHKAEQV